MLPAAGSDRRILPAFDFAAWEFALRDHAVTRRGLVDEHHDSATVHKNAPGKDQSGLDSTSMQ